MTSRLLLPIVVIAAVAFAREASARPAPSHTAPLSRQTAAPGAGWFAGVVEDDQGVALSGVSVLAVGPTFAAAVSDIRGRFVLTLAAGAYLVRAERGDYLSAVHQALVVRANGRTERLIRLTRLRSTTVAAVEGAAQPARTTPGETVNRAENPSEVAWRLRHLTRTVLRDVSPGAMLEAPDRGRASTEHPSSLSLIDWFVQESARATTAWLANTDFTGQVNLISINATPMERARQSSVLWSRSAADLVLGAPVGAVGDWFVRGAVAAGDATSWTVLGEYRARDDQRHALRMAVFYSTQGVAMPRDVPVAVPLPEVRAVGGVRLSDRWRVHESVEVSYGARAERYGYVAQPSLFSPWVTLGVRLPGRLSAQASFADRMVAPGEDQFLPPSASGPWLPPTRTFSALSPGTGLLPEEVRQRAVGLAFALGRRADGPTVTLERFSQSVANQMTTLFGLDEASQVGHYYVGTTGDAALAGWRGRFDGKLVEHVSGSVEFALADARWHRAGASSTAALRAVPGLIRTGRDRVSDLRTSVDVTLPATATRIAVGYRFVTAEAIASAAGALSEPLARGRFNLELHQRLPYQPLDGGVLNLLFTARTLFHEDESGSFYDELLTVRPPLRLTGGLQVRF